MTVPACTHGMPTLTVEATFVSRYDGHCSPCNLPIAVGQVICRLSDGRYVHEGCE